MADIKRLYPEKESTPGLWTMFADATGGFSYFRVTGFIATMTILAVWANACFVAGAIVPIDPSVLGIWGIYAGGKVGQRIFESKEVAAQLDYDFQMAQLNQQLDKTPDE